MVLKFLPNDWRNVGSLIAWAGSGQYALWIGMWDAASQKGVWQATTDSEATGSESQDLKDLADFVFRHMRSKGLI